MSVSFVVIILLVLINIINGCKLIKLNNELAAALRANDYLTRKLQSAYEQLTRLEVKIGNGRTQ